MFCVCVYLCLYVCISRLHEFVYRDVYLCVRVCMDVWMYGCMDAWSLYACMHCMYQVRTRNLESESWFENLWIHTYTHKYINIHTSTSIVHIRTYTCINIHASGGRRCESENVCAQIDRQHGQAARCIYGSKFDRNVKIYVC
jgi:hypothetical protein